MFLSSSLFIRIIDLYNAFPSIGLLISEVFLVFNHLILFKSFMSPYSILVRYKFLLPYIFDPSFSSSPWLPLFDSCSCFPIYFSVFLSHCAKSLHICFFFLLTSSAITLVYHYSLLCTLSSTTPRALSPNETSARLL